MIPKRIELAPQVETERREREIQLLLNVVEPDPVYQAALLTDEASLLDAVGVDPELILRRLELYFEQPLDIELRIPVWQLVDILKRRFPNWLQE